MSIISSFKSLIRNRGFAKNLNKELAKHIEELAKIEALPPNWFWDQKAKKNLENLKKIDESLIDALTRLHDQHKDNPEIFINVIPLLYQLRENLKRIKYGLNLEQQQKEAEMINQITSKLKKLFIERGDARRLLESYGVDMFDNAILIEFLIKHLDDATRIAELAKENKSKVFHYTFPAIKKAGMLKEENWSIIVEGMIKIIENTKNDSTIIFQYYLPQLQESGFLTKNNWQDITKISEYAKENTKHVLGFILNELQKIGVLTKESWPTIIDELIKLMKNNDKKIYQLFSYDLRRLYGAGILTKDTWPYIIEIAHNTKGNTKELFESGLTDLKDAGLLTKENWPAITEGLIRLIKNTQNQAPHIFRSGFRELHNENILTKENWQYLILVSEKAKEDTDNIFLKGLPRLKRAGLLNEESWPVLIKIIEKDRKNASYIFGGLPVFNKFIHSAEDLEFISEKLLAITPYFKGAEEKNFSYLLSHLRYCLELFEIDILDNFIIPVVKSQKVASFLVFESYQDIYSKGAIKSIYDIEFLRYVSTKYLTKANVILKDIVIKGIKKGYIEIPLSKQASILKAFLENTPAYVVDIYPAFKNIYLSQATNKDMQITLLFKDLKNLKKELFEGVLSKEYDEEILFSVVYYVFACHDITVPKENYIYTYKQRDDREEDIPLKFRKPFNVKISKGGYKLKDENVPVNAQSWDLMIKIVREIKQKNEFNISVFGFAMLDDFINKRLSAKKEYYLTGIYQFSYNQGWSLPEFKLEHDVLAKYKEFVGDRIANDLIYGILKESLSTNPELFFSQQTIILGKQIDFSALAKQISSIISSSQTNDKKEEIIGKILRQNGFHLENISEIMIMNTQQISVWLGNQKPNVVEKGLVAKLFNELYGNEYEGMKKEIIKYEFTQSEKGSGAEYTFLLSKRKTHSIAMYNMGVCVAPDNKLWNSPDFWQLIIFDKEKDAHGGAIIRTIEEEGKKYLVLSIQPAQSILNETSPVQLFEKILQFAIIIAKKLDYQNVLIPTNAGIHSNRGSIQSVIQEKYGKSMTLKLKQEYEFSYSSYNYKYQEFYIAH